jgi:hypothetical protein
MTVPIVTVVSPPGCKRASSAATRVFRSLACTSCSCRSWRYHNETGYAKTRPTFVTSPVIDTDPQFFFGAGDNSNGYYGSGKPTLVRYSRMP